MTTSPLSESATGRSAFTPRLDWQPQLTHGQALLCMAVAAAACAGLYLASPPPPPGPRISVKYAAGMATLCASVLWGLRTALLERVYAAWQVPALSLGDADSVFTDMAGVTAHYKRQPAGSAIRATQSHPGGMVAVHCYHGFGANAFSFDAVLGPLSEALAAVSGRVPALVTAHDMPGFGLTSRPEDMEHYSSSFNGALGRQVQDHALQQQKQQQQRGQGEAEAGKTDNAAGCGGVASGKTGEEVGRGGAEAVAAAASASAPLAARPLRRVLLGHSVGALSAALQVLEGPQDVDTLVLVAPAILVSGGELRRQPWGGSLKEQRADMALAGGVNVRRFVPESAAATTAAAATTTAAAGESRQEEEEQHQQQRGRPLSPISNALLSVLALSRALLLMCLLMLLRVMRPLTVLLLRSLVRSRGFWVKGLQASFYDKAQLTDKVGQNRWMPVMSGCQAVTRGDVFHRAS